MPKPLLIRSFVLLVVVCALALGVGTWRDGAAEIGRNWTGFGMLPNGEVGPDFYRTDGLPEAQAPRFQDRVVAIDGQPVVDAAEIRQRLSEKRSGAMVEYTLEAADRQTRTLAIPVFKFTEADWSTLFAPMFIGGIVALLTGVVPILARPDLLAAQVFFALNLGLALNLGFVQSDYFLTHAFLPWSLATGALATGSLILFGFVFPSRIRPAAAHPRALAFSVYGLNVAFWIAFAVALERDPYLVRQLDYLEFGLFQVGAILFFLNVLWSAYRAESAAARQQARFLVVSMVVTAPGGLLFDAMMLGQVDEHFPAVLYVLPAWVLGLLLVYAMIAHNLFELDAVVRRGLTAAVIALGAVAIQLVLLAIVSTFADGAASWAIAGTATVLIVAILTAALPLRQGVESLVERTLFPRLGEARAYVHAASQELAHVRGREEIVATLRETAARTVASDSVRLLAGAPGEPLLEVAPEEGAESLRLAMSDPLRSGLRRQSCNFEVASAGRRAPSRSAMKRASELGIALAIPLAATGEFTGSILVGPRTDGRLHTRDDEILLETLAAQTTVALENARAWESVRELERRLRAENFYLREEIDLAADTGGEMIGSSPELRAVFAQLERVASTDASVLVEGETGTGKELLVRALHARSRRADRMLVKVACAALPEALLESELFGFERGAFSGAVKAKPGRLETADKGTLFLDDIDTLAIGIQAKLLRALQEGEVQRLGSNLLRHVDIRIVAATNRDLMAEVREGRFREDLYYRLNVVPLHLPPLRDRREDIAPLVEHFLREEGPRFGRELRGIAAETLVELKRHSWPGNIRELRNVIQRAVVLSEGDILRLPGPLGGSGSDSPAAAPDESEGSSLADDMRRFKRRSVRAALVKSAGDRDAAATALGVSRPTLARLIRELDLPVELSRSRGRKRAAGR